MARKAQRREPFKKRPMTIDTQVGANIRIHRIAKKLSQTDLARAIGVTFQQVQKYEKGSNRVAPSRLHAIASLLAVSIIDLIPDTQSSPKQDGLLDLDILTTPRGQRLAQAYQRVPAHTRDHIVALVEAVAGITTYLVATKEA